MSRVSRKLALGVVAASAASLALTAAALAGNGDWAYVANPLTVQGPTVASIQSSPNALTPPTCQFSPGGTIYGCYTPGQMRRVYNVPSSLNGFGQTIVIVDAYGDPNIEQDLATFDGIFGVPAPPSFTIYHGSNTQHAGPHGASSWAIETALDVEYAHAIAPGAAIVLAEAPSSSGNAINSTEAAVVSQYPGAIVSQSFGIQENAINGGGNNIQFQQAHQNYAQFTAAGDTILASAGDFGATTGTAANTPSFPSSDPLVTAVGGTQGHPYPYGLYNAGAYGGEEVWNEPQFGSATGGAPSQIFGVPGYQAGLNGYSVRTTPDVAYNAAIDGGVLVVALPFIYLVGGTSCGSPQWAGIFALANQARAAGGKGPLGFANTALYGIYGNASKYAADFHDITIGNNTLAGQPVTGFAAKPGYDLATGIGTPNVANLINDLK
jgi:subtilase family serine protease